MCCEICDKSVQQESVQQLCKKLCARAKMEYEIYSCGKCVASCVQEVYAVTVIETLYKRRKLHTKNILPQTYIRRKHNSASQGLYFGKGRFFFS